MHEHKSQAASAPMFIPDLRNPLNFLRENAKDL